MHDFRDFSYRGSISLLMLVIILRKIKPLHNLGRVWLLQPKTKQTRVFWEKGVAAFNLNVPRQYAVIVVCPQNIRASPNIFRFVIVANKSLTLLNTGLVPSGGGSGGIRSQVSEETDDSTHPNKPPDGPFAVKVCAPVPPRLGTGVVTTSQPWSGCSSWTTCITAVAVTIFSVAKIFPIYVSAHAQ